MNMPGKEKAQLNPSEDRKRYPSRPSKGTVGDIAAAFKKQMSANSPVSEKSNTNLRSSTRNKMKEAKDNKKEKVLKQNEAGLLSLAEASSQESLIEEDALSNHDEQTHSSEEATLIKETPLNKDSPLNKENDKGEDASNETTNPDLATETTEKITEQAEQTEIKETLKSMQHALTKIENAIFHPKNGMEVQLGKTIQRVDDIYTEIHGAVGGIKVRLSTVEESSSESANKIANMETSIARLSKLLDDNKKITQQLSLMQGIIQKFAQQGASTSAKINDLTKRGMEQNIVIHGINEASPKQKENCRERAITFLQENLEVLIDHSDIWKAHRMGYKKENFIRPMILKVAYHAKEKIMENLTKLKGKTNEVTGKPLFISEQVPDAVAETKKQVNARLANINKTNETLPPDQRKKIKVQNDKILVDGELLEPEISTPQPSDLFLSPELQSRVDRINREFVMTEPINIKNSSFIALALKVNQLEQVKLAYIAAMQRFSSADHVLMAYGLREGDKLKFGHCDDNEYGGGMVIRKAMSSYKAKDSVVFVIRRFGGLHLGFERFRAIDKATQEALKILDQ